MDENIVHVLQTILILPALGIMAGVTAGIVKMVLRFQERKTEIHAQAQGGNEPLRQEFEALRQELAHLRDTSTQYDISIQHTLDDLQHRMATLESKKRSASLPAKTIEEESVKIGNRSA